MTPKRPVLNMHNDLTNGKVQVFSDKQIPTDMYTIVSFVIQSGQVTEGGAISLLGTVNSGTFVIVYAEGCWVMCKYLYNNISIQLNSYTFSSLLCILISLLCFCVILVSVYVCTFYSDIRCNTIL